uniref:PH domain-containing protein n=1 Tax=Bicosoecida sp. CB-2014 TaxID=1486930 RepID=A0A7S1GCV1_9STRA|mmetsp:Transcript_28672/g.98973  ORF Transcript_28672/g.98973 Transcript_28672/m.98973 type:complete len:153 (+) Transcript_28672:349-807(+)
MGATESKQLAGEAEHQLDFTAASVKSSWLVKQGKHVKSWKKRWCVLTDSTLCYFAEAVPGAAPKAVVRLAVVSGVSVGVLGDGDDRSPLSFSVETPERCWRFIARSLAERDEWVAAIRGAARRKREAGGAAAGTRSAGGSGSGSGSRGGASA